MSILTRWLLIPPVNARLIGRYRDYRHLLADSGVNLRYSAV